MVIDSSAIVAIAFGEPEAKRFAAAILSAGEPVMPVANWLEAMMVVESRFGREAANETRLLLDELKVRPLPMDERQLHESLEAWRKYGKGRHRAALNMGECCAYAAAIVLGQELLYKGGDFSQTDVVSAAW